LVNLLLILRWIRSFRDTISILHVENVYPQKLGNIFIFFSFVHNFVLYFFG
jgi:hypothetical protein